MKTKLFLAFALLAGVSFFPACSDKDEPVEGENPPQVDPNIPAPQGLTATPDENSVTLSWNPVDNATYNVYRSSGNQSFISIAKGIKTTTYVDISPVKGTNSYEVTAVVGGSESGFSTVAEVYWSEVETFEVDGVSFDMVRVDGGTFMMGSYTGSSDEQPVHSTVATFYIGKTEVTQALWGAVMGSNPSYFRGANLPVENVSWNHCMEFCERLSRITGKNFRLPTEAEWEYAAIGGNKSRGYTYSGSNNLQSVGWYLDNSGSCTHAVGSKLDNELGLYDMSGNVWEWTSDLYSSNYNSYRNGGSSGSYRVARGGSYGSVATSCRSATRYDNSPTYRGSNLGFRLAL